MTKYADPTALLCDVVSNYASVSSYSDNGEVTVHLENGAVHRTLFSTLFQKPDFFKFSFIRAHPYAPLSYMVKQHIIGFDGTGGYSCSRGYGHGESRESPRALTSAIASATGISSGSAYTIGRLLLPVVTGWSILDLQNVRLDGERQIGGVECFLIGGLHPQNVEHELWVEKDTLLLRRIISRREKWYSEESRDNIRVNESFESQMFVA